jgi:hypothetical protein
MASPSSSTDDQQQKLESNPTTTTTTTTTRPSETLESSLSSATSSWWNSVVKTASSLKEKSATTLEIIRTDFADFKQTMSTDTSKFVHTLTDVADSAVPSASATGSSLLNSLTNALGLNSLNLLGDDGTEVLAKDGTWKKADDDDAESKNRRIKMTAANIHERFKMDLKQMQGCEATFLADPNGAGAEFEQWTKAFNSDDFKSKISDLLIENSEMRLLYSQLV